MKELILKHALLNAVEYGGKARVDAILGKVIAEEPKLKEKIRELIKEIKEVVKEVNSMSLEEQRKKIDELGIKKIEKKIEEKVLPELPNAQKGKVVMRLAPFPSGPLHIGNARMVILNDEYVKRYNGKLLLVFDDTIGSEEKFVLPEAYDMIIDGLKWLGIKWDAVYYKSDRLEIFYKYAEELIRKGFAYVCECDPKTLRKNRMEGKECVHRNQSVEENLEKWRNMLEGKYKEGEAVVRLKTDMKYPDPAFRDRVLLRIVEREHPRVGKKYRVWPMLEFSWAIDDHLLGVTHILRGKDLVIEDMMEEFIWEKFGWKKVNFIHYGLFSIKEAKLSKTKAREAIKRGVYKGWDDPRTWSLQSLRKRGILPRAIRKFILSLGLSLADVVIPAEILYAENRKLIDPIANRYFGVLNPVEIRIKGLEVNEVEALRHPDFKERGKRKIRVDPNHIFIEKDDFEKLRGKEVRLMDLCNVVLEKESTLISKELMKELPKIHWVSLPREKVTLIMPDGEEKEMVVESSVKEVKEGEIVQFMRIGFCRKDSEKVFYFTHK